VQRAPRRAVLALYPLDLDLDLEVAPKNQRVCASRVAQGVFFLLTSVIAAHPSLEPMEPASSPPLTSSRPGRSLLTLNMNTRRSRQPAPQLRLVTEAEEIAPATSIPSIPFTPHSPFTPVTLYASTPITRPRLAWSEERALRESLETAFIGMDLRAQSLVEDSDLPPDVLRAPRSPSVGHLEVEEHARGRGWRNEGGRREGTGTGRGRARRGSTASTRGRGTALKSLNVADHSHRRERN